MIKLLLVDNEEGQLLRLSRCPPVWSGYVAQLDPHVTVSASDQSDDNAQASDDTVRDVWKVVVDEPATPEDKTFIERFYSTYLDPEKYPFQHDAAKGLMYGPSEIGAQLELVSSESSSYSLFNCCTWHITSCAC